MIPGGGSCPCCGCPEDHPNPCPCEFTEVHDPGNRDQPPYTATICTVHEHEV